MSYIIKYYKIIQIFFHVFTQLCYPSIFITRYTRIGRASLFPPHGAMNMHIIVLKTFCPARAGEKRRLSISDIKYGESIDGLEKCASIIRNSTITTSCIATIVQDSRQVLIATSHESYFIGVIKSKLLYLDL